MATTARQDIADSREIRVFLSSTFQDMNAEREHLLAHVLPELRRICRDRAISLTEIDLRWGVREEDSHNGLTIELCLHEIDRCRGHPPFFIGFLGERYGWIPSHGDLQRYWEQRQDSPYASRIAQALDTGISVTELEMRYAFLENPAASDHARIYLRSPALTAEFARQTGVAEGALPFYDPADGKLEALKAHLRASPCLGSEGYDTITEFGHQVRDFLLRQINTLYPPESALDAQALRERAHTVYAAWRRQAYVPLPAMRRAVLQSLAAAQADSQPGRILIQAESGMGKSALLADLQAWLPQQTGAWIHAHYIGSDGSRHLDDWFDRLYAGLQGTDKMLSPPPNTVAERWEHLPVALHEVQRGLQQPIVLLLDAIDQLRDTQPLSRLSGLLLPRQVVLIASCTPQPSHSERDWQILILPGLDVGQRREAIAAYLQCYDKRLESDLIDRIATHAAAESPLFLRLLLEEMRLHALHSTLPATVDRLLATQSAAALFLHVLHQLDRDFARDGQSDLATRTARLLALSWRGLREHDLAFLLAREQDPIDPATQRRRLPDVTLSALLAHLEPFCLSDGGRLVILHATLRDTLLQGDESAGLRRVLIDHFRQKDADDAEAAVEQTYQLWRLENRSALADLLAGTAVGLLFASERTLLRDVLAWLGAGLASPTAEVQHIQQGWGALHSNFAPNKDDLVFSVWLARMGFTVLAVALTDFQIAALRRALPDDHPAIADSLSTQATLYMDQGRLIEAELLFTEALEISRRILPDNHPDIATGLNNLGILFINQERLNEAKPLLTQALEISNQTLPNNHPSVAQSFNNLGMLYQNQGRLGEAETLFIQALEVYRRALSGNHPDMAACLNNLAMLYQAQGRLSEAEPPLIEALEISRQVLPENHPHIAISLNNLAALYEKQGRLNESERLYGKSLEIRRLTLPENHPDVAINLGNLADLYENQGRLKEAESLYAQALDIRRRTLPENDPEIARSLNDIGTLYVRQGRLKEAEPLLVQALDIRRTALPENHPDIGQSLNNLAALYINLERLKDAEPLLIESLEIARRVLPDNHPNLAKSLNNLGVLHLQQGRLNEAEHLIIQALKTYRLASTENEPGFADSINNLAALYRRQGRAGKAEALLARFAPRTELGGPPPLRFVARSFDPAMSRQPGE